jgi:hypothetical protein
VARERIGLPPSDVTGPLGAWLRDVYRALNQIPNASYISVDNPNTSGFTGYPGDLAVNVVSGSTVSRIWVMGGASVSTNSWAVVRTAS